MSLACALVLLVVFVAIEYRTRDPMVPLILLRDRLVSAANVVGLLFSASLIAMSAMALLALQRVLHARLPPVWPCSPRPWRW